MLLLFFKVTSLFQPLPVIENLLPVLFFIFSSAVLADTKTILCSIEPFSEFAVMYISPGKYEIESGVISVPSIFTETADFANQTLLSILNGPQKPFIHLSFSGMVNPIHEPASVKHPTRLILCSGVTDMFNMFGY